MEQSTVIGIVTGALGVVVLILLLVCVMLLAIVAKPRKTKRRPEAQSSNGDDVHDPSLLCMTSSSTLSYYENVEGVLAALKANNASGANGHASHRRSIASDNVNKDGTRESYVSIESILDAKRLERGEWRLHSTAETVETYEDMDGVISDTTWPHEDQHSLDETWEKYEIMNSPMDMLTGMNQLQGDKNLHGLNGGWEEDMDCMPVYYDSFEDTYDSDELNNDAALDKRPKGEPDIHALGKPGHEMAKKINAVTEYDITDSVLRKCDACEEIYDDIADVGVIYDMVGEAETNRQLGQHPGRKAGAQPPKLPPRLPVKPSVKQPARSLIQQARPMPGTLHGQQAYEGPDKLSVGKTSTRYQALCQPTLADIHHQYTKLRHNQEHQDLKRPPSYQYSSVRETLRRTGAGGEMTGRPPSRQYSSLRKLSHRSGEDRPPSHQYSSVGETPHSTDETGVLQYLQYI